MLEKLEEKYEDLYRAGRIKSKWTEIEDYGMTELVHAIFGYDEGLAVTAEVDNGTVCLNLYEGIPYEQDNVLYTLAKAYMDTENNIIFTTPSGELFMYETGVLDANDPRHLFADAE